MMEEFGLEFNHQIRLAVDKLILELRREILDTSVTQARGALAQVTTPLGTSIAPTSIPPLDGDVTGPLVNNIVEKLRGIDVSATPPIALQVLTAINTASAEWQDAVRSHDDLTGLSADDHPQYVKLSLVDAIGDLLVGSGDNTLARLAKGTDGTTLQVIAGVLTWVALAHSDLTGLSNDDHPQYQLRTEKDSASGYAGLNANSRVPPARLGTGSVGAGMLALFDDETYKSVVISSQYRVMTYVLDGSGGFEFVVDGAGNPVTALADLE